MQRCPGPGDNHLWQEDKIQVLWAEISTWESQVMARWCVLWPCQMGGAPLSISAFQKWPPVCLREAPRPDGLITHLQPVNLFSNFKFFPTMYIIILRCLSQSVFLYLLHYFLISSSCELYEHRNMLVLFLSQCPVYVYGMYKWHYDCKAKEPDLSTRFPDYYKTTSKR